MAVEASVEGTSWARSLIEVLFRDVEGIRNIVVQKREQYFAFQSF